jgi:hypothetical protein
MTMRRITSALLDEDILFLDKLEKSENIENKDNLVVYSYAEQYLIRECKPRKDDLKFIHNLKKAFGGTIERRDYASRNFGRRYYQNEPGTRAENECSTESIFDAAKSISISSDVFEFFKDYRKFREKAKGS